MGDLAPHRVLVIEDEPSYVDALEVALGNEGFSVESARDGRAGLRSVRERVPDVVVLDLMLPGLAGLDVLRRIRQEGGTPVVVVSAKAAESDVVSALELGADDYLIKPYSLRELVARLRAALRRSHPVEQADVLTAGNAVLDLARHELRLGDEVQQPPRKEFALLRLLMERPGRVVTREEALDEVWGYGWVGETKTLDQHIRRLRRRLEAVPGAPEIETVRGVGYRLEGEVSPPACGGSPERQRGEGGSYVRTAQPSCGCHAATTAGPPAPSGTARSLSGCRGNRCGTRR